MNDDDHPLLSLLMHFAILSLFAVGGANAAMPEMHRLAVEVKHWMSDRQFGDMFAISQLSPGPNVLIVTLIGYHVAGIAGALLATLGMCAPSATCAYFVSRIWEKAKDRPWRAIVQAALVPVSIGLVAASAYLLTLTIDRTWQAAGLTVVTAAFAMFSKWNPLWMLAIGAVLGFAGLV